MSAPLRYENPCFHLKHSFLVQSTKINLQTLIHVQKPPIFIAPLLTFPRHQLNPTETQPTA